MTKNQQDKLKNWGLGIYRSVIIALISVLLNYTVKQYNDWQAFKQDMLIEKGLQAQINTVQNGINQEVHQQIVQANQTLSQKADRTQVDFIQSQIFKLK